MKKLFALVLSFCLCLTMCPKVFADENENIIKNGNFINGTEPWYINKKDNTNGVVEVTNEGAQFKVTQTNGNPWELGLHQGQLVLEDGSKYILSFEAKVDSDIEKPLRVVVENQDPNWEKNLEEYVNLSNEFQKFTFEFTKKVGSKNQLAFSTGFDENLHHTFTFKNVSLIPAPVQKIGHYLLDEQNGTAGVLTGTEENVKVEVAKTNQQFWDLSLKKRNIQLEKKKRYDLSFCIDSSQAGKISFDLESMQDYNNKTIKRQMLNLKAGENHFSFEFLQANDDLQNLVFFLSYGDGNTDMTNAKLAFHQITFKEVEDLRNTYVVNGGFDDDIAGWKISNNNGTDLKAEVKDGKAVLSISNQGNDFWDSKFIQDRIAVNNGKYKVSFDIGSNVEDVTQVYFSVESTDVINGSAKKYLCDENDQPIAISLNKTKDMKTYSFEFDVLIEELIKSTEDLTIRFDLGKPYEGSLEGKELYLDNIKLERVGDLQQKNIAHTNVEFDVNHVITEDFKGLGVQWDPYQVHPLTDREWKMVTDRVDYLNPQFVRCMIYATTYCKGVDKNGKPIFDFENKEMKPLIQQLDYLQDRQIETVFGEWEAPGKVGGAFEGITCDNPVWAEMIAGLMDYLINEKGYTCIKYYNMVNEANSDWSYCGDYDLWQKGIKNLHKEFKKIGIEDKVKITGPDTVWDRNHQWLKNIENDPDMKEKIGLFDVHMYPTYDEITSGYIEKFVTEQRQTVTGQDFYMTEIGMVTGKVDGDTQKYAKEFCYGAIMADAAAQVLRGGLSGVAIWDLDDAMHNQGNGYPDSDIRSLKQWGFWNSIAGRVYQQPEQEKIRPHFYTWSLMTHLFPRHCQIIQSTAENNLNGLRTVGMKLPNGDITYMIVNNSNVAKKVTVKDNSQITSRKVLQYNYFDNDRIVNEQGYPVVKEVKENVNFVNGVDVELPSGGVVFLTTLDTNDYVQETKVEFHNIDADTNEAIIGSKFELRDQTGHVVDQWTTQEKAHQINGLKTNGQYVLVQTDSVKGFVKSEDINITIQDTVQLQTWTIKNKHMKGQVNIIVKDKDSHALLSDAEYLLKDEQGNILEVLKTDEQGKAISQLYEIAQFKNGSIQKNFIYSLQAKGNLSGYQQDTQKYMIEFDSFDTDITQKTITIELMKKAQVDIKPDDQKDEPNQDIPQDIVHTSDSSQITLLCLSMLITILFFNLIYPKKKDN
ncbi:MAG: carbohydrate binding domain-containing protein [Longibaculum muris]|uniref:Carbohydrate binding protein n=1 Tax=Longibaculum muris TaxID=1796628 RepID=A0A4R3Z7V1_9FIRM|nr:carbohydrate binding domain-containing protein [Longibaculum muris]MBS5370498.1 carbohydrate binding domain-containing protein [Coprobacillus cateniformis]MCR1886439.1 carbohydrate binding domain-containing protein [Longibaculum muris]MED9811011.1 carbohydrate binding domain-containing protein [Longibaculum muris]TCW02764.1 carbohydrate binding protein [Longibaculum muris]